MDRKMRMANLELLRIVAMMMVVVLHFLGKGGLLRDVLKNPVPSNVVGLDGVGIAAWVIESLCIVAVNVYMFISGYFLCQSTFKPGRLIKLWLQLWFYSVVFGLVGALTGVVAETTVDTHYFLTLLFPVSMGHYWFMTAYIYLYLLLPFVGLAVKRMTKKQMQTSVILLLAVFCLLKSVLPFRLEMDEKGYDCLWYLCVFVFAAYVRKYGLSFLQSRRKCLALYLSAALLSFGEVMLLRAVYLKTGSLSWIVSIGMEYNHILPFLGAVGLCGVFLNIKVPERTAPLVLNVAPYTLGVYLFHENIGLRYSWQRLFHADRIAGVGGLIWWTLFATISVFICGIVIDWLRTLLMKGAACLIDKWSLGRKLQRKLVEVDNVFKESV